MGYRELLKRYLCFLETHAGSTYLDALSDDPEPPLGPRDLAELRSLMREIDRDVSARQGALGLPDFNRRLGLLCVCYGLGAAEAAELAQVELETLRRWRTSPRSVRYMVMQGHEFRRFEGALFARILEPPRRVEEGSNERARRRGSLLT
jgi:hypothetical protein